MPTKVELFEESGARFAVVCLLPVPTVKARSCRAVAEPCISAETTVPIGVLKKRTNPLIGKFSVVTLAVATGYRSRSRDE